MGVSFWGGGWERGLVNDYVNVGRECLLNMHSHMLHPGSTN